MIMNQKRTSSSARARCPMLSVDAACDRASRGRLQGARVRVPVRRQRRQQHHRSRGHRGLCAVRGGAHRRLGPAARASVARCRSSRRALERRSACIRAAPSSQTLFNQRKLAVIVQRRHAGAADVEVAIRRGARSVVALLALGPAGAVAELGVRGAVGNRMGRAHRRQGRGTERRRAFSRRDVARRHRALRHRQRDFAAGDPGVGLVRARGLQQQRHERRTPRPH